MRRSMLPPRPRASSGRPYDSRRVPIERKCIGATEIDVATSNRADMLECFDTLRQFGSMGDLGIDGFLQLPGVVRHHDVGHERKGARYHTELRQIPATSQRNRADLDGTLQRVDRLATFERPIDLVAEFRQRVVITQIDRAQQFAE
jgi:hypothetical protein